MDRYQFSRDYLQRAKAITPGGAQTLSKFPCRFPEGAFPAALSLGAGAYVYDVDNNKYLDFICGLASMTLGYGRKEIADAVTAQMYACGGPTFSLAHPMETWVAERLCRVIPCAEMVRFVKTGSEATEAAIRVARRVTSRDLIVTVKDGYHSWHSWFQVVKDFHPGIPDFYKEGVLYANYNDLKGFAYLFDRIADNIAAVILEPCHNEPPAPGFLEGLRKLCDDYGAILIFDEMVTGFRWANGGAQEFFGVTPDLACFGKACANGFPLAFLCGRGEYMERADVISGTFGGEVLSLAACEAVLDIYTAEPVVTTMWARGWQLVGGLRDTIGAIDAMVPVVCDGYPIKPRIRFTSPIEDNNLNAMSLFLELTAASGLLIHPAGFNLSYAMTREDIEDAIRKISIALFAVAEAYELGHFPLKGNQIQPSLGVRTA